MGHAPKDTLSRLKYAANEPHFQNRYIGELAFGYVNLEIQSRLLPYHFPNSCRNMTKDRKLSSGDLCLFD